MLPNNPFAASLPRLSLVSPCALLSIARCSVFVDRSAQPVKHPDPNPESYKAALLPFGWS